MTKVVSKSAYFDSQQALNYSGILVTAMVGGLGAWSISYTPLFPLAVLLSATQLLLFVIRTQFAGSTSYRLLFWLQGLCIGSLIFLVPSYFIYILTVVWLVQAVELYGVRGAVWLLIASLIWFFMAQLYYFRLSEPLELIISAGLYSLLNMFAISVVQRSITERDQKEHMTALNRELIATRDLLSQSAAQSERLRIARDLHDILGHHMTALVLNLEVASHSVEGHPKEKVEQSLALAKLLLGDLRSTVGDLREEGAIHLEDSIKKLVSGIPGIDIDVDFSNAPVIDDVDLAETFLRCTQEAITNMLRHSSADHCRIIMTSDRNRCVLSVCDNGKVEKAIEPGNGLKGMSERVTASGGELVWHQNEKGFQLQVTMGADTVS